MIPRRWVVVAVVVLALVLTGCQVVVIPVPVPLAAAEPDSEPAPAQPVDGANDPEVLAQFDAITAACSSDFTHAQQERAMDEIRPYFAGREVQLVGTVDNVRDLSGSFDVIVSLDGAGRDVRMPSIPEEQALSLNKGDQVVLVGEVDAQGCWAYVQIDGTLSPK